MLFSLGLIILFGILFGSFFERIKLPSLLGMLIAGIIIGPYGFNLIDKSVLNISGELRTFALVVILTRAGLNLDLDILRKVGISAILMCFLPATFEIFGIYLIAPKVLNISAIDSLILGAVLAAVSPAVVVPKMLKLIDEGYGRKSGIPDLIMAGASVDDIFVIVIFTALLSIRTGGSVSIFSIISIPISILLGILFGSILGNILSILFKKFNIINEKKILILLSISFVLLFFENTIKSTIPFSGLIAVMAFSASLKKKSESIARDLSKSFSSIWVFAEILLFVLVGASVNISYAFKLSYLPLIVIIFGLIFRAIGVNIAILKSDLNKKERLFTTISYMPKATVQAAISSIPLSMGISSGETILTVGVFAILFTAPIFAKLIDFSYKKLLIKD
ncbi:cation:proton antiporter [Peptoniphilus stercorisuis]|uniref:NhaP-type Na+/H+ or K+/H+ antiporter n=1 Tax=Peptoniphilus stercorisuis TaxID=1436965 RepID=A0ABS4KA42_9FIRM|nr:cation:proton antiporter [Peptoniphilus stercorisuis]MBP2024617.1 NhaP-type Na+/H+ or K+/H+ antiporter [Peptoniphilus stercorisuis]